MVTYIRLTSANLRDLAMGLDVEFDETLTITSPVPKRQDTVTIVDPLPDEVEGLRRTLDIHRRDSKAELDAKAEELTRVYRRNDELRRAMGQQDQRHQEHEKVQAARLHELKFLIRSLALELSKS